jgi:hypothetical protein
MRYSKLPFHQSLWGTQKMSSEVTCLKMVARGVAQNLLQIGEHLCSYSTRGGHSFWWSCCFVFSLAALRSWCLVPLSLLLHTIACRKLNVALMLFVMVLTVFLHSHWCLGTHDEVVLRNSLMRGNWMKFEYDDSAQSAAFGPQSVGRFIHSLRWVLANS